VTLLLLLLMVLDYFFYSVPVLCTGTDSVSHPAPVLALNQGSAACIEGDLCDFTYELLSQLLGVLRGEINIQYSCKV